MYSEAMLTTDEIRKDRLGVQFTPWPPHRLWPRQSSAWKPRGEGMIRHNSSFFWIVAHFVESAQVLNQDLPQKTISQILADVKVGLELFLGSERVEELMPLSTKRARSFLQEVNRSRGVLQDEVSRFSSSNISDLRNQLREFSQSVQDELDRLHTFTVTAKGNLSIDCLTDGASSGYPQFVRELIDAFIGREIDEAGRCLAAGRFTASGFHILRAVETATKGYVVAATGSLPPIRNRNWGTYIDLLTNAPTPASSDLLDALKVLRTKRNPLMHPKDNLEEYEAISLFCISQATLEALISDVQAKHMDKKFTNALENLPTM